MPSRKDLGTAHLDPPLVWVTLAPRQPDPAWTQRVAPGPNVRQRHLSALWDPALEARGVQAALHISFPCPIVVMGGSNLPEGQEPVGMFAYRLGSGHWRVQTGVARNGEEGTVTKAGVLVNVITGWQQRKPEWVDVAWLAMRIHVGRQRKGGGLTSLTPRGRRTPPPPLRPGSGKRMPPPPQGDTDAPPPPPTSPAYGHPGGAGGAGGRAGAEGGGGGVGGAAASAAAGGCVGGARNERGGRQPRPRGPPVQGQ